MDKETCKNLYHRYLELKDKMKASRIMPDKRVNIISSRDIDELYEIRNKVKKCLEFFSNEELRMLYTDEEIGPKSREIVRERRI